MNNLVCIPLVSLTSLSAEKAVSTIKSLFSAELAYIRLSPSALTISENIYISDGGIDAQVVVDQDIATDSLFKKGLTGYQLKSGQSFKPWINSSIKAELVNSQNSLNSEVESLLKKRGRYVVICNGHDLTPERRNKAKTLIAEIFKSNGYKDYEALIDVIGASQLAGFIERYPPITATLVNNVIQDALVLNDWQQNVHMSNSFSPSKEQSKLINQIRSNLLGDTKHIRVLGEPGLGKSRLVLEAVRDENISPTVLYFEHGLQFGQSQTFKYLLKNKVEYPLVLVVDELPENEMIEIWGHLKNRCGALKLVTLDHGLDQTQDSEITRLQVPKLDDETIHKIISSRVGASQHLDRWVGICEGSPRVAQAVADNLYMNPEDILRPPSTVQLWDRFLHGYAGRGQTESKQIDLVCRYIALFSRFGYEDPVDNEARYIAGLIERADPLITWVRFQEIIRVLREKRVLQGYRTLFFVPKALHIYLWQQFWLCYGRGFHFLEFFEVMPASLHAWFMSMFKYADAGSIAHVIKDILKSDGIYADKATLASDKGSKFLSVLAEASPGEVLSLLDSTLGTWTDAELTAFKDHRQNIVWTLEKIAVWKIFTVRALSLLTKFAINENATNSNNATGTLIALFRIGPEHAATEASPIEKLPPLLTLMRSQDDRAKLLSLSIIKTALNTNGMFSRIVGPEYQGLKVRANLWKPQTYGEWSEAYLQYFELLVNETPMWPIHLKGQVSETLLQVVEYQILVPPATELAFYTLEKLMHEPSLEVSKLNQFFYHWQERKHDPSHNVITKRLAKFAIRFSQRSLQSRFQRYVIDVSYQEWDEDFRERSGKTKNRAKQLVRALAQRICKQPCLLTQISPLLSPTKSSTPALWYFGEQLAHCDGDYVFLENLLNLALETKHYFCLSGYLTVVKTECDDIYHKTILRLLNSQSDAWLGARLTIQSPYDSVLFERCLIALNEGWIEPREFSWLRMGRSWDAVSTTHMKRLILKLHAFEDVNVAQMLLELLNAIPFEASAPFTADLVFENLIRLISKVHRSNTMDGYYWNEVCNKLMRWDEAYAMPLLDKIFYAMADEYSLSYDNYVGGTANQLVKLNPSQSWQLLTKHFEATLPKWRSDLLSWLKGGLMTFDDKDSYGPLADFVIDEVFIWIEQDANGRAPLIAHAVPKTLDVSDGGGVTLELIKRYSNIDGVKSGVSSVFLSGSWTGLESHHLKTKREKFRTWLGCGFDYQVVQWLDEEIGYLDQRIEQAEVNEERDRFE